MTYSFDIASTTGMWHAIGSKDVASLTHHVSRRADVRGHFNYSSESSRCLPLSFAIHLGFLEGAELLLKAGASLHKKEHSAWQMAMASRSLEALDLLMRHRQPRPEDWLFMLKSGVTGMSPHGNLFEPDEWAPRIRSYMTKPLGFGQTCRLLAGFNQVFPGRDEQALGQLEASASEGLLSFRPRRALMTSVELAGLNAYLDSLLVPAEEWPVLQAHPRIESVLVANHFPFDACLPLVAAKENNEGLGQWVAGYAHAEMEACVPRAGARGRVLRM